ncbi:MAG: hypothetical protein V3V01_11260 [Acidimicrobiales bacterium]
MRALAFLAAIIVAALIAATPAIAGPGYARGEAKPITPEQVEQRGPEAKQPVTKAEKADYNGREIDLSESWEGARACAVGDGGTQCFDSEMAMNIEIGKQDKAKGTANSRNYTCSSSLRLYKNTSYSGSTLWITSRGFWLNLSNYGYNQSVSSYKVGACSSIFADYNNGGGAWYPTAYTKKWKISWTMLSGWNDDVSSVYQY